MATACEAKSENASQANLKAKYSKQRYSGIYGPTIGEKYNDGATVGKKLSLGNQVSRKERELILTPKDQRRRPPVGHYHPQYGQVNNRPKSQGFSKM